MRKILVITLILVSVTLTGCSRQGEGDQRVVVRFWNAMGGPLGDIMQEMIDEFNAAHPGWYIKSESMGYYDALFPKIFASIIARNQPTMAQAYEAWISRLIEAEQGSAVADMTDMEGGREMMESGDIYPILIANSTYNGRLMSLPFNKSVPVIYYNKDLFRKAGLDPDRPPATWSEFIQASKKLTVDLDGDGKIDQWGHMFSDQATYFECLVAQNGGELLAPGKDRVLFNSPEGVEALQYLVDLVHKHKAADFYLGGFQHQVDFMGGKVGMIFGSCVSRTFMKEQIKFDWGIAPLPRGKKKIVLMYGTSIIIFSAAPQEKQRVAWEFVRWFTDRDQTARWSMETNYMPIRRSALTTEKMIQHFKDDPDSLVSLKELDYSFFDPRIPNWLECRRIMADGVKEALLGKNSPKEALDRSAARCNRLLR